MYLYIHGFLSSSRSSKAQQLKRWLAEQGREKSWLCPDLPIDPTAAMTMLREYLMTIDQPVKLVGSSLGGFYATKLSEEFDLKAVLINPAVHAGKILEQSTGSHQSWHEGEPLEFTSADVDALNAIDTQGIKYPDNIFLMVEKDDETLDYREAVDFYRDCHQLVFNGGNHSFTRFRQVLPLIEQF